MNKILKLKSLAIVVTLCVGMMACTTTGGSNSSIYSTLMPVLQQILQSGNGSLLTPLLGKNFSLGGKTGDQAANLASQVLNNAPAISNISLKNTSESNGNTILNTIMNVAGQGSVSSPIILDSSGKISSIGVLENLLSSGILKNKQ